MLVFVDCGVGEFFESMSFRALGRGAVMMAMSREVYAYAQKDFE